MLSSTASLRLRAKSGLSSGLSVPGSKSVSTRPFSSISCPKYGLNKSQAQAPSNRLVSSLNLASNTSNISQSSSIISREYHGSSIVYKKKEVNAKALANQGKRKEKPQEDDAASKLVDRPAPAVLAQQAAQAAAERASTPLSEEEQAMTEEERFLAKKLVDTRPDDHLSANRIENLFGDKHWMATLMVKVREKYPAMFNLIKYHAVRMTPEERFEMLQKLMRSNELRKDPEVNKLAKWWERVYGTGSAENVWEYRMRRRGLALRIQLAQTWKELDAHLAELKAELDEANLFAPDLTLEPTAEELSEVEGDQEALDLLQTNPLDDPEIQTVISYFVDPRPSIDPTGTLEKALVPDNIADIELLALVERRKKQLAQNVGMSPTLKQKLQEKQYTDGEIDEMLENPPTDPKERAVWDAKMKEAEESMRQAEAKGLNEETYSQFIESLKKNDHEDFMQPLTGSRFELDVGDETVDDETSSLEKILEFYERAKAPQLTEADRALNSLQYDEEMVDDIMESDDAKLEAIMEAQFINVIKSDPEMAEINHEVNSMLSAITDDDVEEAIHPLYSERVLREYPQDKSPLTYLTEEEKAEMVKEFRSQVQTLWGVKEENVDGVQTNEIEEIVDPVQRHKAMMKMLDIPDLTVRQQTKEILISTLKQIQQRAEKSLVNDHTPFDNAIKSMVEDIKANPEIMETLQPEQIAFLDELATFDDGPHLPLGNPMQQAEDALESLKMAKDMILDYHADITTAEAQLDQFFADARKITEYDLKTNPEWLQQFKAMHREVYGDGEPLPDATSIVTHEEYIADMERMAKTKVLVQEAKSSMERESLSAVNMLKKQWTPMLPKDHRLPLPTKPEPGFYQLTDEDIEVEVPITERLYVSSDTNIDTIFSNSCVGKYLQLTDRDMKRYLPEGVSSRLANQEFTSTATKSILIRPQALEAIANLKAQRNNAFIVDKNGGKEAARPMLLYGYRGCGKSAILAQVVYWARRSDWLVINVSDGNKWLSDGFYISKNLTEGTWDQPKRMVQFFNHLLDAHHDKLKQIPVKNPLTIGKLVPKNLFEIVEYGSVLEQYAAQCFLAFRNELRLVTEFPVLLAFDSYNTLYNPSAWKDPESQTYYKEPLYPEDLTLGRFFFDAHLNPKLTFGTFVGALTEANPVRAFASYKPNKENGLALTEPKYLEVTPYTMNEFTTVMEHYKHCNWVRTKMSPGSSSELYIYQLTSGFGEAVWTYTKKL